MNVVAAMSRGGTLIRSGTTIRILVVARGTLMKCCAAAREKRHGEAHLVQLLDTIAVETADLPLSLSLQVCLWLCKRSGALFQMRLMFV